MAMTATLWSGSGSNDELDGNTSGRTLICLLENVSRHDITHQYWATNSPGVAVVMALLFLAASSWNAFILYSMVKSQSKLLRTPAHSIIFSLALNDLLLSVLIMPISIITTIAHDYPFGSSDYVRCKVCQYGVIFTILSVGSLHHIAILSADRFLFIYLPISYKRWVTRRRMVIVLIGVWILSILIGILPLFGFGAVGYSDAAGTCITIFHGETRLTSNIYYVLLVLLEALIPLTLIIISNVALLCTARKHLKKRYIARKQMHKSSGEKLEVSGTGKTEVSREWNKQQLQLLKIFGALFVGNVITWIPVLGLAAASQAIDFDRVSDDAIAFVYMSYISHALIHPILESWFITDIKVRAKKLLCFFCNKVKRTAGASLAMSQDTLESTRNKSCVSNTSCTDTTMGMCQSHTQTREVSDEAQILNSATETTEDSTSAPVKPL